MGHAVNRALLLGLATSKRLAGGLGLLIGASFLIYATIRLAPGDAVDAITPMGTPDDVRAQIAAEFGLDRNTIAGYLTWLKRSITGDFGNSLVFLPGATVMEAVWEPFLRTLMLSCGALLGCLFLALGGALLLGEPSGRQQIVTGPLYALTSAPSFVVAVVFAQIANWFIFTYLVKQGYQAPPWFPIPISSDSNMPYLFAALALVAGDGLFMDYLNAVRAELLALRRSQFITAVKAKGARTARHIVRNMLVPIFSSYAARLPIVLGGVVIVEYIFTLEGAGYVLLEAARARDFPIVVGICVLFTATIIAVSLLADLVRALVDPREVARGG
jgi:peptide/nickel transport system permease protein